MAIFLFRVTIDDDGDQKTWEYGVNEVGAFEARERIRQYLTGEGVKFPQIEDSPPRNVASLADLSLGDVRLVT
jgi:hypothetical protein